MTDATRVVVVPAAPVLLSRNAGLTDPVADLRVACQEAVAWLADGARDGIVLLCGAPSAPDRARGLDLALSRELGVELLHGAGRVAAQVREVGDRPERDDVSGDLPSDLSGRDVLVLADGSARRSERAPGFVDPRAVAYDEEVGRALAAGDVAALRRLDVELGTELLADGPRVLAALAHCLDEDTVSPTRTTYDDDPFGVQYWVVRWGPDG